MAVDISKLPGALGADVKRVNEDGTPTDAVLDWDGFNAYFVRAAVDDLDTRVTTSTSDITSLETEVDGISASGQIRFQVGTTATGADASYGVEIQTSTPGVWASAGFYLDLFGSESVCRVVADRFMLQDPDINGGDALNVLEYDGSIPGLVLGVPLYVRNGDILANAVSNTVINTGTVSSGASLTTPSLTVRAGARVQIEVKVSNTSSSIYLSSSSTSFTLQSFSVTRDGGTAVGTLYSMDSLIANNFLGGSAYAFYKAVTPSSEVFVVTGLSAGTHTFDVANSTLYTLGMSIAATELAK